jgi:hypothetical protein
LRAAFRRGSNSSVVHAARIDSIGKLFGRRAQTHASRECSVASTRHAYSLAGETTRFHRRLIASLRCDHDRDDSIGKVSRPQGQSTIGFRVVLLQSVLTRP